MAVHWCPQCNRTYSTEELKAWQCPDCNIAPVVVRELRDPIRVLRGFLPLVVLLWVCWEASLRALTECAARDVAKSSPQRSPPRVTTAKWAATLVNCISPELVFPTLITVIG